MADGLGGPDATFSAAAASFERYIPDGQIGVAVSGGSDSMALLAMLMRWAAGRDFSIHAATVDHGLRPEARDEASMVAEFCATHDVPHHILSIVVPDGPGNLSAKARDARYAALTDWFFEQRCIRNAPLLLGHTMDDQAETVLMRLARGSGAEGLSAMSANRVSRGITWVRPLLGIRRAALRDWLRTAGITWIEDPTNTDEQFDRVKARRALEVLDPLGVTVEGLADTAVTLSRQREVLDASAMAYRRMAVRTGAVGSVMISRKVRGEVQRDTQLRVFAEVLQSVGGASYRPRFRSVEPLWDWAISAREDRARTLAGCIILPRPDLDEIMIFREAAAQPPIVPLAVPWDGWYVDTARQDLWIGPLGDAGDALVMRGGEPLREGWRDLPRALRITAPTLYATHDPAPDAILAVPHAGWVRDASVADLVPLRSGMS